MVGALWLITFKQWRAHKLRVGLTTLGIALGVAVFFAIRTGNATLLDSLRSTVEKLAGKTKIVATKVMSSPQGSAPFHRIVEVYFPSTQSLEACAASEGGKQTLAHAVSISSGGTPIFLVAEEETFTFDRSAQSA